MHLMLPSSLEAEILNRSLKFSVCLKGCSNYLKFFKRDGRYFSKLNQWLGLFYIFLRQTFFNYLLWKKMYPLDGEFLLQCKFALPLPIPGIRLNFVILPSG